MILLAPLLVSVLWAGGASDDALPAALDQALFGPTTGGTNVPFLLEGPLVWRERPLGQGRSLEVLGDVTGDGLDDLAVGFAPGTIPGDDPQVLQAHDGATGEVLWSAAVPGGGFRTLRGLARSGDRLLVGASSAGGWVASHDAASGAQLWGRDLGGDGAPTNVLSVAAFGDGLAGGLAGGLGDVLVAAGAGLDAVLLLSGGDGSTLWSHPFPGGASDARPCSDRTGDGIADVVVAGDDGEARLLSGVDGSLVWSAALDGPGTAVMPHSGDINGDGVLDVIVGQFAAPGPCVVGLDGDTGDRLWVSNDMTSDVTSLDLLDDLLDTGLEDIAVGSFDNAVTALLAFNGASEWRREVSTVTGGSVLSVVVTADLNGDGVRDVYGASVDRFVYVMGGPNGQFIGKVDMRGRLANVVALQDVSGDGRPEMLAVGTRVVAVGDGATGTAAGPVLIVEPPRTLASETLVLAWAYPGSQLMLFGSLGPGAHPVPGFGVFGLDLGTLEVLHTGGAPGAGISGYILPPFPHEFTGAQIYMQVATIFSPGVGALSEVEQFQLP